MSGDHLGFVGIGRMGSRMAQRLLDAGYGVTVFDVDEAAVAALVGKGAVGAASPREVAEAAGTVLVSLPTPPVLREAVLGAGGLVEGARMKTLIDLSTTGPAMARLVAEALGERDVQWVDSPVSGGLAGAAGGTLTLMVSCPAATFEAIEPMLATFGKVVLVGEKPGLGQVVKLGNNMMAAAALVVASEALAMGTKAGVDPEVMVEIINSSTGRNSATQDKFPRAILPGTFDFGFATGLSYKDVRMCVDESEAMGVPMMAGAMVRQFLAITQAKYGADSDFTCIAKVVEEWAGVEIRSRTG